MSRSFGRYRLIAEIGRGGMAEVFVAVASTGAFSKLVVIKKLREHLAGDTEFVSMLLDEARIAGLLNHPNLVQTIEVGEHEGEFFLTMEYLDGQPLHRIVRRGQDFPLMMHLSVLSEVLVGMEYAHDLTDLDGGPLNIVHRDLTPHNIFVTYQGVTKVVDFGIAKALGRASETRHGVVKGKAPYMAPEQTLGAEIDRRVDVYAVGVMLYEAAARRRMWQGVSEMDIVSRLVAGDIPSSPKKVNPAIDDELDRICQRALSHSPGDRYPNSAAMNKDLRAYITSKGPPPTNQEIGAYVAKLFADKRAATNKVIEEQAALSRSAVSIPRAPSSGLLSTMSGEGQTSATSSTGSTTTGLGRKTSTTGTGGKAPTPAAPPVSTTPMNTAATVPDAKPPEPAAPEPTQGPAWLNRRVMLGAALAVAVGMAMITVFLLASIAKVGPDGPVANGKEDAFVSTAPITVTLRATPLETRFFIDDGPALENPFIGTFPRDRREHVIRATAPGYPSQRETVIFNDDVSMRFTVSPGQH